MTDGGCSTVREAAAGTVAAAGAVVGAAPVIVGTGHTGDRSSDGSTHGPLLPTPPGRGAGGTALSVATATAAVVGGGSGLGGGGGGWGSVPSGEGVVEEERLRGKSIEAKGSTGVSPMQKRNRRELKVRPRHPTYRLP